MSFAHRADVSSKVLGPDPLDGERDAAGPVGDAVAVAAVLEGFVFDVVTQQLVVRTPPLHRQLRELRVVLIVIGTWQRDRLTGPTQNSDNTACTHNSHR